MGIITSVSVTVMDAFNLLLFHSNFIKTPGEIIFLFVLNRITMVSLGELYWFYGYVGLYIIYSVLLVWMISRNRFPFEGDLIIKGANLKSLLKKDSKKETMEEIKSKGIRNPISLLAILTSLYFLMICIIQFGNIKGVKPKAIQFYYINEKGELK